MTETPILDERAVSEIEARVPVSSYSTGVHKPQLRVLLSPAERDALCATMKHLRAENEDLREQLASTERLYADDSERFRGLLAQVEQERDRILQLYNSAWLWVQQRVKHPNSGLPPAAITLMEMLPLLNERAIQLCKELAEYAAQVLAEQSDNPQRDICNYDDYRKGQIQAAKELREQLEKL